MTTKCIFYSLFLALIAMVSCTREEEMTNSELPIYSPADTFLPNEKGNIWIYEIYVQENPEGEFKGTGIYDTLTAIGDTIIETPRGMKSFHGVKSTYGFDNYGSSAGQILFFRDSTDGLYYRYGELMLSTSDSEKHVYFSSAQVIQTIQMHLQSICKIDLGEYECIYAENTILELQTGKKKYHGSRYFVKGLGIIKETIQSTDDRQVEKRLVEYHLK